MADDDKKDVFVRSECDDDSSMDEEGLVRLKFYLTPETMAELEKIVKERNMSVGDTASALMTEYFEEQAELEQLVKELVLKSFVREIRRTISPKYAEIMRAKRGRMM